MKKLNQSSEVKHPSQMKKVYAERELAALAKGLRQRAKKSKADVARELNVSEPAVFAAEEKPELSFAKLRIRMIETYSPYKVEGPVFVLRKA
jgi:DNA-binding XRE family transcriptional regulator